MQKYLYSIFMATMLVALSLTYVACTNTFDEERMPINENVDSDSERCTIPVEVALGEESTRLFDEELHWGWEESDVVYGSQIHTAAKVVNPMTLNDSGHFHNEAFEITTSIFTKSHYYLFAYPRLDVVDKSWSNLTGSYCVTTVQDGRWTPAMAGLTATKLTTDQLTAGDSGRVAMQHLSAAFEIRVWEVGGRESGERMAISRATLRSAEDFVGEWIVKESGGTLAVTQRLNGKEIVVEDIQDDVVVFNIAPGTYDFVLDLEAPNGEGVVLPLTAKSFEAGKRTVLNVEWRRAVSIENVTSWYEDYRSNPETTLEQGYIYIEGLAWESGTPVVYVDGVASEVVDGRIAVSAGRHRVYASIESCRTKIFDVDVYNKASLESATILTSYERSDGTVLCSNQYDGMSIYVCDVVLSEPGSADSAVADIAYRSPSDYFGLNVKRATVPLSEAYVSGVTPGRYKIDVTVRLDNGYPCGELSATLSVTGIPTEANFMQNSYEGWSWFSPASLLGKPTVSIGEVDYGLYKFNTLILEPQLDNPLLMNSEHSVVIASPSFYLPETLNVIASVVAHSRNMDTSFDVPLGEESVTVEDKEAYRHTYIDVSGSLGSLVGSFIPQMTDTYIEGNYALLPSRDTEYASYPEVIALSPGMLDKNKKILFSRFFKYHKQYVNKIKVEYAE